MNRTNLDRRHFLTTSLTAAGSVVGPSLLPPPARCAEQPPAGAPTEGPQPPTLTKLSEHLSVYRGAINVGIVRDGPKALLIDCGDGSVAAALAELGITAVDQLLLTHHHRDQACGAETFAAAGARIAVPATERECFEKVADYWNKPQSRWHIYNLHPHHLMLAEPLRVDVALADGQELTWGPAKIRVLATPGHTNGSVSYLVEVDGRKVAFSGDAIYDAGQVWDLHSLQKGTRTSDYHGFLGARAELVEGLGRLKAARPDSLVPSHGKFMTEPDRAIDLLCARLDQCYDKYVAISALRHYFPAMFTAYTGRKDHMAIRPGKPVPGCLRHFGTTWLLVSKDRAAFAMDCGGPGIVDRIKALIDRGEVTAIEGLWVTHYHDDHVDGIPAFRKAFSCPCITDRFVAEVIGDPPAWRLPCISPAKVQVDRPTRDGESWQWHEFRLSAYHFPGQTLYHSGLFVEGEGLRLLFAGDSFTPAGIDDYCMHNRNWLGDGVGFDRCVALIEKLQPTHIFNCHVDLAFDFTAEQCRAMRANLAERRQVFGQVVPWDHPNYAMDEPWVRCAPYEQKAQPGGEAALRVVMTNHSDQSRQAACRAVLPAWRADSRGLSSGWTTIQIAPKSDGQAALSVRVPADARPGRNVIPIDVRYGPWYLPQFTEAIVVL